VGFFFSRQGLLLPEDFFFASQKLRLPQGFFCSDGLFEVHG
jgi:hypothetical protein